MPELPDVEIFKRVLDEHGVGRMVEHVAVPDPGSLEGATGPALQRRLQDQHLSASSRHGKVLFAVFEDAATLAMHFGTNGSLRALRAKEHEPASTRILFSFADGERLAYVNPRRIGHVCVTDSPTEFVATEQMGPDALHPAFDEKAFSALLAKRRQPIKAVLMDQGRIAGIGNIYADEILFQACLHPGLAAQSLDVATRRRLFEAMQLVLRTAIACGAGAEEFTDRLPNGFLLPQRHAGGQCPRCGAGLTMDKRGGRTSYHCPKCQQEPKG